MGHCKSSPRREKKSNLSFSSRIRIRDSYFEHGFGFWMPWNPTWISKQCFRSCKPYSTVRRQWRYLPLIFLKTKFTFLHQNKYCHCHCHRYAYTEGIKKRLACCFSGWCSEWRRLCGAVRRAKLFPRAHLSR